MANTILDTTVIDLGGYDSTYDTVTMGTGGIDTITLTGSGSASITSPMTTTYTNPYTFTTTGTSNIATGYVTSNGTWATGTSTPSIQVKGDADFDGDVKLKGKSLTSWMETMEKRLAILVPDPKKLEKFEALQKAYNHYKMLEALCDIEDDTTE
jgi:hypothetical protein